MLRIAFFLILFVIPLASQARDYRYAVYPFLDPVKLEAFMSLWANEVAKELRAEVRIVTKSDMNEYHKYLETGHPDIVYAQAETLTNANISDLYVPIGRVDIAVGGYFVAKNAQHPPVKGAVIAVPKRPALNYLMAIETLTEEGLVPSLDYTLVEKDNQSACLKAVLVESAQFCVTYQNALRHFENSESLRFHRVLKAKPMPQPILLANKRLTPEEMKKIQAGILSAFQSPEGQARLSLSGANEWVNLPIPASASNE